MRIKHSKLTFFLSNRLIEQFVAGTVARTAEARQAKRHLRKYNPVLSLSKGEYPPKISICSS